MPRKALIMGAEASKEGLFTCNRGESAWAANVAKLFCKLGYETYVWTTNGIDDSTLSKEYRVKHPANCHFINGPIEILQSYAPFDAAFHFCLLYKENTRLFKELEKISKKILLGTYWPSALTGKIPENCSIVSPYLSKNGVKVLPRYSVDRIREPSFKNKHIIWTARSPFNKDQRSYGEFRTNLFYLEATLEALKRGYKVTFLCRNEGFITHKKGPHDLYTKAVNTLKTIDTFGNVSSLPFIPRDEFEDYLEKGSITIPAELMGSTPTAIHFGLVPVLHYFPNKTVISEDVLSGLGIYKHPYDSYTREDIFDRVFQLLESEDEFNRQLSLLRSNFPIFTDEEACKLLLKALGRSAKSPSISIPPTTTVAKKKDTSLRHKMLQTLTNPVSHSDVLSGGPVTRTKRGKR